MDGFYRLADGFEYYTTKGICDVLKIDEAQGFPLEDGSYIEKMTIAQFVRVIRGEYDA